MTHQRPSPPGEGARRADGAPNNKHEQHRTQSFPFRGRCPKGGWGPQQQARTAPDTVLPLQGKVPERRMGPPTTSTNSTGHSPSPPGEGARRADGAPKNKHEQHRTQSFPSRGRCPKGGWGPREPTKPPVSRRLQDTAARGTYINRQLTRRPSAPRWSGTECPRPLRSARCTPPCARRRGPARSHRASCRRTP